MSRRGGLKKQLKLGVMAAVSVMVAYVIITIIATVIYWHRHGNEPYRPGVSFSIKYARELGLDWQANYLALLNDMHVKRFRLMSYWDEGEPQPGVYKFDDLDWQIQQAEKSGAKVSLAIGLRQPRYPECHEPDWASKLNKDQQKQALEQYIAVTVDRYKSSPAIVSWQLENEALNTAFGQCKDFSRSRLEEEYKLVKQHDSSHPTIVSVSNEFGLPLIGPIPDVVGFSIYHRVYQSWGKFYFDYPLPPVWHGTRAALIELFERRPVMIHELQTEPWGPTSTAQLSIAEQNKSMDAKRLIDHVRYAQQTSIREYYLWGGEWWYWRKVKFHDDSLWNAAAQVFADDRRSF